jgi:hypothetical protein
MDILVREQQFSDGSGLVFLGQRHGVKMSDMMLKCGGAAHGPRGPRGIGAA